jgi:type VI secretion system secreted protein Hcp
MASDMFLKIDGIDGESTDEEHQGEIEILSWSWGASNPTAVGSGGGAGTGKVSFQDFHFTHAVDAASPQLMMRCASGQHIAKATLTVRKAGAEGKTRDYLVFTLTDCVVSSIDESEGSGDLAQEDLALRYRRIEMAYQTAAGATMKGSWDLATGKKV